MGLPSETGEPPLSSSVNTDWRRVLADIGRAATRLGRTRLRRFSIEGTRLHERALRAGVAVEAALVSNGYARNPSPRIRRLLARLREDGCPVHVAADAVLSGLTEGRDIGAIVGLVPRPAALDLGALKQCTRNPAMLLLAAIDVEDPGNVGAMTRTALAAGADAFATVGISDAFHPRAVRTSMGAVFRLPILEYESVDRLLRELRAHDVQTVGAVSRGGQPLHELELDRRAVAVLMGCEAVGLEEDVRSAADRLVSVPMPAGVDSFSVHAAAAIILYEIRRPRR